jgi:hypothetical protein
MLKLEIMKVDEFLQIKKRDRKEAEKAIKSSLKKTSAPSDFNLRNSNESSKY